MSSQTEELVLKVLFNNLILEKIFSSLTINELLPLRLTSKLWNISINKRISEDKTVYFESANLPRNLENMKHLRELKIQKVLLSCWPYCAHYTDRDRAICQPEKQNIFKELGNIGNQLRSLEIPGKWIIGSIVDIKFLKSIFSSFPNLQRFLARLEVDVPLFTEEFKNFVYPSLRFLKIPYTTVSSSENGEQFVQQLIKIFPNLDTNFDSEIPDLNLLHLIQKKKVSPIRIRNYQDSLCPRTNCNPDCLKILATVSIPLTNLELCCNPSIEPIVYTKILQNFSKTLANVKLLTEAGGVTMRYEGEIYIPPLPNARKIWLGTPPFRGSEGLKFSWNLGKSIAKDFPLLEHFTFKLKLFDMQSIKILNPNPYVLFEESWCKFWDSFVPLSHENDKEGDYLSSLKYLKLVDLSFPNHWIGIEKNRGWCSMFLRAYLKLYGNGGKTKVIQDMIDWLK